MPLDRFMIAPYQTGLQENVRAWINYASSGNIFLFTKGCIMKLRKDAKDLTGQTFEDLTVIKPVEHRKTDKRGVEWLCRCICGNDCIAQGGHLRAGERKSCGCRAQRSIKKSGITRIFLMYRRRAQQKERIFTIDKKKLGDLILSNCHYCGREPFNVLKRLKSKKIQLMYNGIDRYDPELGYTNENCVPCCYYCNHAKLDLTFDQWISHLKKICSYQGLINGATT